jgi:glyoxylase-like metal-dependent hydrolase (beta-lactamase superfamily II)
VARRHLAGDGGGSATSWFAVRELERGVHVLAEPAHVNSFLVAGSERAVLIDTGLGIGNIRRVVESLTDLDVLVVNTHYHFDHSGGNRWFERIAIHEAGATPLGQPVPDDVFERYMAYTRRMLEGFGVYADLDDRFFHFLGDETTPRPLPSDFDPASWRTTPTVPTRLLRDGDILELGGRSLRVLHTPGHTPDCISLLDEANGILFGGDTINTGPIYAQLPDSDIPAFAASTRRLADLADDVRIVYVPHFLRYAPDPMLLREIAAGFADLLAGDVRWRTSRDCLDYSVREAVFARFSILVPDESADETTPILTTRA